MKKIIALTAALLLTTSCVFAERFVEFGLDVSADASENLMGATDIFVKDLVIDLTDIADNMGNNGMVISTHINPNVYFNLNVGPFGGGLDAGFSANAKLGLSKEFFDFLAYGNELGKPIEVNLNSSMEVYAQASATGRFKVGNFAVTVTPGLFVPIFYMPNPEAKLVLNMNEDGTISGTAAANYKIYSASDVTGLLSDGEGTSFNVDVLTQSLMNTASLIGTSAGFDVAGTVKMPFIFNLTLGGYAQVPLVPGHLHNSVYGTATVEGNVDGILNGVMNSQESSEPMYEFGYTLSDTKYSTEDNFAVNRPSRLGATVEWTPFGDWCVFYGSLGFGARNPFGKDFKFGDSTYTEYSLGLDATLLYLLNFNFVTQYQQEIFSHNLGLKLDLYVLELHVNVGLSSSDFAKSFTGSGFNAGLGLSIGI